MSRTPRKTVLFLLAHQDDETLMSTRVEDEVARGHRVLCAFLTDGSLRGVDPRRRDAESLRVLGRLGVPADRVAFVGTEERIPDGSLHRHLDAGFRALARRLEPDAIRRIYTCAFEGGHQDHDATHLVALALARRRGLLGRTWQVPLYNGFERPWKFFTVQRPLPGARRRCVRRLPFGRAWRHAALPLLYPSQWRSWIGLLPGYVVERGFLRRDTILSVDPERAAARPHEGALLYERRTSCTWAEFEAATREFVLRYVSRVRPV